MIIADSSVFPTSDRLRPDAHDRHAGHPREPGRSPTSTPSAEKARWYPTRHDDRRLLRTVPLRTRDRRGRQRLHRGRGLGNGLFDGFQRRASDFALPVRQDERRRRGRRDSTRLDRAVRKAAVAALRATLPLARQLTAAGVDAVASGTSSSPARAPPRTTGLADALAGLPALVIGASARGVRDTETTPTTSATSTARVSPSRASSTCPTSRSVTST